jgi:hypothetical protein
MKDPIFVRFVESERDLRPDADKFFEGKRAAFKARCKSLSLEVLHDQIFGPVVSADVKKRADVRVLDRADGTSFALKALLSVFIFD